MPERVAMCWSGGKDSVLALRELFGDPDVEVVALVVTITQPQDRVSMHGVRRELIETQAAILDLPLYSTIIPAAASNEIYLRSMQETFARVREEQTISQVAFGDLFLQDIRNWREAQFDSLPLKPIFPIWGSDTRELADAFIDAGFRAILTCIDPRKMDPSFAGREFDLDLLRDLPGDVDPCGENGEFHTFVYDGPLFSRPAPCKIGAITERNGFIFRDLLTTELLENNAV